MAEIWGAAIAVGGAVISGYAQSKEKKADRKAAASEARAATKDEAKWSAVLSRFEKQQDYYYNQLNRQNKERGLAEFRKFSSMGSFAPEYQQTNTGVVLPQQTDINQVEQQVAPTAQKTGGGGSGGKGLLEKIDPLGSKLLKKLF